VSTWFVLAQHRSAWEAATTTSVTGLAGQWARPLSTGSALGAVAFAHLRRQGPTTIAARRDAGGWRVDGALDWVTGWGLADVLCLMVRADDDVLVALLPAGERPGLVASAPLDLMAVSATSTVAMELDGVRVGDDEIALRLPYAEWLRADALRTANCVPAVFGLARALVARIAQHADERGDDAAGEAALRLAERVRSIRSDAYTLVDDVPDDAEVPRRVELRAASLRVLSEAADAVVVLGGGRAAGAGSRSARWAAEARFFLVQAQTAALRSTWLAAVAR
jgi:alkylation response protein AidB-like acyl-CoA dehydrogenase